MKKSNCFWILGVVIVGVVLTCTVVAQQSGKAPTQRSVALVDVYYIISQNARLQQEMKQIEQKYEKAMQDVNASRQELVKLEDMMRNYEPNSEKYREGEQLFLKRARDLESQVNLLIKQMTEEQFQVTNAAYNNVVFHTKRCAQYFGMSVVLNYNRENKPIDQVPLLPSIQQYQNLFRTYRQSLLVGKAVVWADESSVELTSMVLNEIQKADPSTKRAPETTVQAKPAAPNAAVGAQARPQTRP
ncbi:MAG: OmpH family outer membrane protein [Planctomycetia bacterium]|nr:OmpH family outer membrane protein [Planctomycetia bacterium]